MTLPRPKRRKPVKMMVRESTVIRSPGHLRFVRAHECAVCGGLPSGYPIEAAHVRTGTDGGMGMKPSDSWTIPLCAHHHRDQHMIGEAEFENIFKINMKAFAENLWLISPHGKAYRAKLEAK